LAIEVKRSTSLHAEDLRALRELKMDYPPAKCFVFYGGTAPLYFGDIVAIPLPQALQNLDGVLNGTWEPHSR
jgi:hypothetical protein